LVSSVSRIKITVTEGLAGISSADIKRIIKNVLLLGYGQSQYEDYAPFFEKLSNSNSAYLEQTQDKLFIGIYYTLKFLSLLNVPEFRQFADDCDYCFYKSPNFFSQDLIKITHNLRTRIMSERTLQNAIRDSIIRQFSSSQYDISSIPFELFQNADDALMERIEHGKAAANNKIPEGQSIFIVESHEEENHEKYLVFRHFGREINRTYDERDSSYMYDLENMLTLHSSYKENGRETGKFGLGFKSVYFICDEPVIRSGSLQIKIVGGFYPEKLEEYRQLKNNETTIELLLKNDARIDGVIDSFKVNAPFQAVFGKAIHCINILGEKYTWLPECQLNQNAKIDNSFSYDIETGKAGADDYLKLTIYKDQKHFTSLLFKYDGETEKIQPMHNDAISKIWNTTSLQNDKTLKFAINADFRVDLGRKTVVQGLNNNKHEMLLKEGESLAQPTM
jgi:hypothetical protein